MIFISLVKLRRKVTKEMVANADRLGEREAKEGVKVLGWYWTLGRYDGVRIFEAPDEKTAMKFAISAGDMASTETLVAVSRQEAVKLVEE